MVFVSGRTYKCVVMRVVLNGALSKLPDSVFWFGRCKTKDMRLTLNIDRQMKAENMTQWIGFLK